MELPQPPFLNFHQFQQRILLPLTLKPFLSALRRACGAWGKITTHWSQSR